MIFTRGIYIDGEYFNIPIVSIKRNADFLDKFAERVETGELQRELIGVYFNYTMSVGRAARSRMAYINVSGIRLQSPSHSILFRCRQILVITNTQLIYPASLMNTRR